MRRIGMSETQLGEGWFGFLYVLVTFGLFGLFLIHSVPVYITANAVDEAIAGAAHDPDLRGAGYRAIHRSVEKRFHTSYVDNVSADKLRIIKVPGGRKLEIEYSITRPFLFNVGLHYTFHKFAIMPASNK